MNHKKNLLTLSTATLVTLCSFAATGCSQGASMTGITATLKQAKNYHVGETIKKSDVKVQGNYSDSTKKDLAESEWTIDIAESGYTFTAADAVAGHKDFTVTASSYKYTLKIVVQGDTPVPVTLESITASLKQPKSYSVGEAITKDDIKVLGTYSDGTQSIVPNNEWLIDNIPTGTYTFTDEDATRGNKTFTIKSTAKPLITTTLTVTVNTPTPSGYQVDEDEWKAAFDCLVPDTPSELINFTFSVNIEMEGNRTNASGQFEGTKYKVTAEETTTFGEYENNTAIEKDSSNNNWKISVKNSHFNSGENIIFKVLKAFTASYIGARFDETQQYYIVENEESYSTFQFNSNKKLTTATIRSYGPEVVETLWHFNFNEYGTTSINDFPSDTPRVLTGFAKDSQGNLVYNQEGMTNGLHFFNFNTSELLDTAGAIKIVPNGNYFDFSSEGIAKIQTFVNHDDIKNSVSYPETGGMAIRQQITLNSSFSFAVNIINCDEPTNVVITCSKL